MSKELLISRTLNEWRAVLMENGEIIDYLMDRLDGSEQEKPRVGDIYKGKVLRVLPGMQSAFVDIGWQKAAFLYVDDAYLPSLEEQREASEKFKEVQKQLEKKKSERSFQTSSALYPKQWRCGLRLVPQLSHF